MNRLGNIRLPPLSAAVNVAGQTLRQIIHEKAPGHERVHFAQVNHTTHGGTSDEHHEMTNMKTTNPFLMQENFEAEESFNEGYKNQSRMSSVDFSEGSDFVEGKSDVKISEYQAAWNVTNAIQVRSYGGGAGIVFFSRGCLLFRYLLRSSVEVTGL